MRVVVTRRIADSALQKIMSRYEVVLYDSDYPPTREWLESNIRGADGVLCMLTDRFDSELLEKAERLKVLSSMSVGLDHVDLDAATRRGVYVTYTPDVLTDATADLTWALLLAAARRVCEADRFVRGGLWKVAWAPNLLLGSDVYGKTLGIIGMGRIGYAVAKRATGFGMQILYHQRHRIPEDKERVVNARYVSLEELLSTSDYVTIHLPLTEQTKGLINEKRLRLMKPTSYLINTSRGAIVDEKALIKALKEGWIKGAALDVYEKEPLPEDSPLLKLDNLVLTPHIGSATTETRNKMAEIAAENLIVVLTGALPRYLANTDVVRVRPLVS
ncbi:MAG: D-glycerate dehydrogenase [Thaumarchaeota archaeon]|nr:D-glycerate dehydrogenase [Nitrososphaerota archaeon]